MTSCLFSDDVKHIPKLIMHYKHSIDMLNMNDKCMVHIRMNLNKFLKQNYNESTCRL